jgi:predicted aminopeptidase
VTHLLRALLAAALFATLAGTGGCANTGYYAQAVKGQVRYLGAREPIVEVLQRDDLDADIRRRLELAREVRFFARDELALPVKGQYRDYVQLTGDYPVWSVFAAPELSLEAVRWCFLFGALCTEYRGYFLEADAQEFAAGLRARGHDVEVSGVAAFSSLGVFDDPLTSLLVKMPDDLMAMVLFHELAHSVVFAKDDTLFNESFAQAVAEEGLRRWLTARGAPPDSPVLAQHRAQYARLTQVALATRQKLQALYAGNAPDDGKRAGKAAILAQARADYLALCEREPLPGGCAYADWFGAGLNNARLNAVATYEARVPAFRALLAAHDGDLAAFYDTVRALAELPADARRKALQAMMPAEAGAIGAAPGPSVDTANDLNP